MAQRRILGLPVWALVLGGLLVLLLIGLLLLNVVVNLANGQGWLAPVTCYESAGCSFWHPILYSLVYVILLLTGFAYTTLLERRFIAFFQQRVGPNRVGPQGVLQPVADGLKLIFKEDIEPEKAYKAVYRIAPMIKAIPVIILIAVLPLGPDITIPWFDGVWYTIPLAIADINVGILWILAITSIATYGVVLAGWASNNKYAMLGGLRASAQMISYELSLGLAMIVPVMIAGSMSITDIIDAQGGLLVNWFVFQNPLAAAILLIALVAETNRAPFDLPEAEQELTAGYMTEYSAMKFALFYLAEYMGMIAVSLVAASLFFGGYNSGIGIESGVPIIGPLVLIGKVILFLIGFVWLRSTLPRFRYDRLMTFGWKVMLPLALLSVAWTAVAVIIGDTFGQFAYFVVSSGVFGLVIVGGLLYLLRNGTETADDEKALEDDPIITGERTGLGFLVLQAVGALVAIPFVLYERTLRLLDNLARLGEEAAPAVPEVSEDEAPATPPAQTGGD